MATTFKAVLPLTVAGLALVALGSCGESKNAGPAGDAAGGAGDQTAQASQLFPDNFKGVCSGAPVSKATAYVAGKAGHKALYFATYNDDLMDMPSSLPADWTVQFSPDKDAYQAVDLVVCAKRTAAKEAKICDGYKNKGSATQNKVRWHTATYDLTAMEATTGKQLAEKTVDATSTDCPMFMNFDNETETIDGYATPSDSIIADFLRPYITG